MLTYTTKTGEKIVCDSPEAFEEICRQYFPQIPATAWSLQK